MAYTVKKGDTLQGLYGPNWKTISGFTGDPTKLQIGTQLPDIPVKPSVSSVMPSIQPPIPSVQPQTPQIAAQQPVQPQISPSLTPGATLPQTPATTQPTADDIATALIAKLGGVGTQETPESRRQSYLDFITGQQKTYGEQLGIPGQEARLSPIKQQIDQTNEMLDKLEADLNERVKGLGVGENLRRRYLAAEQGPLTQQLGELGRAYAPLSSELQTNKQRLAEMMGLSKEAFEYGQELSPQQQLAQKIAEQQALQAIEPPKYTSVSPGETIYDPKTGKTIFTGPTKPTTPEYREVQGGLYDITNNKWIVQPKAPTPTAPVSPTGANYNTRLNQEISNIYSGRYGKEGAREKVISLLQREFSGVDIATDIYLRVPDKWESQAKGSSGDQARLDELLTKSGNGQNLDKLTPEELNELRGLI